MESAKRRMIGSPPSATSCWNTAIVAPRLRHHKGLFANCLSAIFRTALALPQRGVPQTHAPHLFVLCAPDDIAHWTGGRRWSSAMAEDWSRLLSFVVASVGAAQSEDSAKHPSPPARIGNHYNHKAYQPRAPDVCAAEKSSGIDCDSPAGMQAQRGTRSDVAHYVVDVRQRMPRARNIRRE